MPGPARARRPTLAVIAAALAGSASGLAQSPPVFRAEIGLVSLQAAVRNARGEPVVGLDRRAFTVYENGAAQTITVFRHDEVPISLGILLDNSRSMRELRPSVAAAALAALRSTRPEDEVFLVNFADKARVEIPFTSDLAALEAGVAGIGALGGTAIRDAIAIAQRYSKQHAARQRRVLLVITDGNDNASETSLERLEQQAEADDLAIWAVGLLHAEAAPGAERGRDALRTLTNATGGVARFVATADEAGSAARQSAGQMRHLYTIGYSPIGQSLDGSYRKLRVVAKGGERLRVRTRGGYWARPASARQSESDDVNHGPRR